MEKAIVLYEGNENWRRAYLRTLAGEQLVVSNAFIDERYFEIMVFETDNHARIIDYSEYEYYRVYDRADAEQLFEETIETWRSESRTLDERLIQIMQYCYK